MMNIVQNELQIKEIQINALGILQRVASFCEENKLRYSLAYGTLIGAVRHKGFIPWDDDIDIIMPRSDYNIFVSSYYDSQYPIIKGDGLSNHLHVVVSDSKTIVEFKSQYDSFFYKGGIWVDIFPIDIVPDSNRQYQALKNRIRILCKLQHMAELSIKRNNIVINTIAYLFHLSLSPFANLFGKNVDKLMLKNNASEFQTCANLSLWYLNYPPFPRTWLQEYTMLEFEGNFYKVLSNYHEFLTRIYGDYMQLPPEQERVPRHSYIAYYK